MASGVRRDGCDALVAAYRPRKELREVPVDPASTALLVIDVQNYTCHKRGALVQTVGELSTYFWERLSNVTIPSIAKLQSGCRECGVEVIFTVIESMTQNCRDNSLDYRISGLHVPRGCWDSKVLEDIKPHGDEIVFGKTSSSVFVSTNIDYVLRNMGINQLLICGGLTDQCIESAVRDACDLGYLVTLLSDCCITHSKDRHENAIDSIKGYCRTRSCDEILQEFEKATRGKT